MKKIWTLITLTATAVFSGLAMSKFLNWAGQQEIFDFDLDEDIDNEEIQITYITSIGPNYYLCTGHCNTD